MSALKITTVRVDGQPLSTRYRCEGLIRLPYHDSVLLLERNPEIYAEHLCPNCIFQGTDSATFSSSHQEFSISTNFQGLDRRGSLPARTHALTCDGFSPQRSEFFRGWPQTIMSKIATPSDSVCFMKRSFRRCHDVHARTDGISIRLCQWRLPDGPCEEIAGNHRDQLIAVTKGNAFLDSLPLVQLAWRTKVFGADPQSSEPTVCTRGDENIACAVVDASSVPSFLDKRHGSAVSVLAHGSLWHARDIPGQKVLSVMCFIHKC
jgi:uncharacterized protein CbrC (UPF0167 family)